VTHSRDIQRIIPLADPRGDHAHLRDEIMAALERTVDSGSYILGKEVEAFEHRLAARLNTAGAVGVGSGTEALALGLLAVGVSSGDEVVTVSHTAGATVAAIRMIGAVPMLIDIDEASYCMDPQWVESAITSRTKAILPVHLYGHPADLVSIGAIARLHNIPVVEDCAQAQEATIEGRAVGSIGQVGCFSFYPTKNLGAVGDGGLAVAIAPETVERLRRLRTYGWSRPQFADIPDGRCSRLDELQAAILNVKVNHLARDVERRREIAQRYNEAFAGLPLTLPAEYDGACHVYHLYVVRSDRRDAVALHLKEAGIDTGIHYPCPVHLQPGLMTGARIAGSLKVTEMVAKEILSLPLYPSLSIESQQRVIEAVREFFVS
jgi:dTDP-4-amino-4,6-dideoxygalactose transaminase